MVKRNLCRACERPVAKGSRGYCSEHLRYFREYNRKRRGLKAWKPGGPGRPPLERKTTA